MRHIVVCGFPRAGTTLLYNMLRTTAQGWVTYPHEKRADRAHQEDPESSKITKRPTDMADYRDLSRHIQGVEFVVCVRDPRSILVSGHDHAPGQYKISWDHALKTHKDRGVIGKAPGLVERHHKARALVETRPIPTVEVYYEDLVRYPDAVQAELGQALRLKYQGDFRDFINHDIPERLALQMNGVRPVETSRIQSWRQHPERIRQQFRECPQLFEIVRYWGYEISNDWIKDL